MIAKKTLNICDARETVDLGREYVEADYVAMSLCNLIFNFYNINSPQEIVIIKNDAMVDTITWR